MEEDTEGVETTVDAISTSSVLTTLALEAVFTGSGDVSMSSDNDLNAPLTPAAKLMVFTKGLATRLPTNVVVDCNVCVVSCVFFRIGPISSRNKSTRRRTCHNNSNRIMPTMMEPNAKRMIEMSRRSASTAITSILSEQWPHFTLSTTQRQTSKARQRSFLPQDEPARASEHPTAEASPRADR